MKLIMKNNDLYFNRDKFIVQALQNFEGGKLLNALLSIEIIIEAYKKNKPIENLFFPTPYLAIKSIERTIDDKYPNGKKYLMDMIYYDRFYIKMNVIIYLTLFIIFVGSVYALIKPDTFKKLAKLSPLIDIELVQIIVSIVIIVSLICHYFYASKIFIDLLQTFKILKSSMLKSAENHLEMINNIMQLTQDEILEVQETESDFNIRNQVSALIFEMTKQEYGRVDKLVELSQIITPKENFIKQPTPDETGKKSDIMQPKDVPDKKSKRSMGSIGNSIKSLTINSRRNRLSRKIDREIRRNSHQVQLGYEEYLNNQKEIDEKINFSANKRSLNDDGISSSSEISQCLIKHIISNISSVHKSYDEKNALKSRLLNFKKGLASLSRDLQIDPDKVMKEKNIVQIFRDLGIFEVDEKGDVVHINIQTLGILNTGDTSTQDQTGIKYN